MTPSGRGVCAVLATFNRRDVLRGTLKAVNEQTVPPDLVIVVDNCSVDGTAAMVAEEFPAIEYIASGENAGQAPALWRGMTVARARGLSSYWLLDDDSRAPPDVLETLLGLSTSSENVGVVGCAGGVRRRGVIRHVPGTDLPRRIGGGRNADFCLIDGSLVTERAVELAGLPRTDFFLMVDDIEYPLRIKRSGLEVVVLDDDPMERGHLGSGGGGTSSPPWRGYYQTRNELRLALEDRSPLELAGWARRQVNFLYGAVTASDRRRERLKMRFLGAWHGARGRMNRVIEPGP